MFDSDAKKSDIFEKFEKIGQRAEAVLSLGKLPFGMTFDEILSPTRALVNGREIILAGTNNYLGLTFSEAVKSAAIDAIARQGTATTGSRLANGTFREHIDLEEDLKTFFGAKSAVVFTTGYQANLAAISTLAGRGDHLLIDADSHACIYDGCRLSDAETIRFRHNSPEDLAKRLARLPDEGARLVVVEGLYSMLGDVAPLDEFVAVAHEHGAYLYVDEAHSVGCYGERGRGLADALGVLDKIDFLSGTFSKSFASIGGFCVSRHSGLDLMRLVSRPYLFTASGSPSNVAAARAAMGEMMNGPDLSRELMARAHQLHAGLAEAGFAPASPPGPIIALPRPDELTAVREWNQLLAAGIYVNLAVPPATPHAKSLLRLSVSAAHSAQEIDAIVSAFRDLT
ncbi:MAG: 8-amino-7-oxononanoate synthase [Hyphomonas sp.]|uniref:serine palmitoyltransferase n=1 Tax=Hyphomonas sp. TaxID=87 RepID=UPI001D8B6B25|nr:aminotransferase class I/II-fold pyridoxal phosphate-dependent enzyme [Hyphomonas sp.]MBA4225609.1 8-amino-7-oxononanoate synthase [Hyphomonas sp.]